MTQNSPETRDELAVNMMDELAAALTGNRMPGTSQPDITEIVRQVLIEGWANSDILFQKHWKLMFGDEVRPLKKWNCPHCTAMTCDRCAAVNTES